MDHVVDPATVAPTCSSLAELNGHAVNCFACPRLVAWRELVAFEKRASFVGEEYWGRPAPGFGDPRAGAVVVGLAPAAHGANRTGRMFTGDRSGDWLYRAMYRAGFANQPTSVSRDDGLELTNAWITAAARCAPPANKPTPDELATCRPWLLRELELLEPTLRVAVCLGQIGYHTLWNALAAFGDQLPKPRPKFGHGVEVVTPRLTILCSYHPSQQNTFTGKLTEPMLDGVFARAWELASS
ncbi:MAG: Uracil-DNA glycosylase superfamily [Thermoleophilia bacterium]|nr:Uracil-DNA glycosylase superfamily [Thermoleophilia bacterium]